MHDRDEDETLIAWMDKYFDRVAILGLFIFALGLCIGATVMLLFGHG